MIGYLLLCLITILTGHGILRLTRVRVEFDSALFLAPVLTLIFWSIFLGWGVLFGFPVKHLWIIGWAVTLLLALYGLQCSKRQFLNVKWILLIGVIVIPVGLMAPFFWHGIKTYPGSCLWDGWSYIAFGQYLWEYPLGAEGGLAPLYQYASHLSHTRFMSSALLAFFSPMSGSLRDVQAASGYFLAFGVFLFSSASMYFIFTWWKVRTTWVFLTYVIITVFSGWTINVFSVNNYDNALILPLFPVFAAVIYSLDPKEWRWSIVLGGLAGAAVYCYPEMMPALFVGVFFLFLQKAFSEKMFFKTFVMQIGIATIIAVLFSAPYLKTVFSYIQSQLLCSFEQQISRPGEGFFPQLLSLRYFLSAFWGFGAPFETGFHSASSIWECIKTTVAIFLTILAIIGLIALFRQKLWGIVALVLTLFCGAAAMILKLSYSYGAYKFLLLNWWSINFAVVFGVNTILVFFRESKLRGSIFATFIVILLTNIGITWARVVSFDKSFVPVKNSMTLRCVRKIKSFVGKEPVIINVKDDYAHLWAVYYLRDVNIHLLDYHVYMAQSHVVPLMNRAKPVAFSNLRYLLTDDQKMTASSSMKLIWKGGPYQLWKMVIK